MSFVFQNSDIDVQISKLFGFMCLLSLVSKFVYILNVSIYYFSNKIGKNAGHVIMNKFIFSEIIKRNKNWLV